jgi:acyl dehydratase
MVAAVGIAPPRLPLSRKPSPTPLAAARAVFHSPPDRRDRGDAMGETTSTGAATGVVLHGLDGLQERAGQDLGTSSWRTVEQAQIDLFATLTGDEQWIHTDPERAAAGPFGATVQHGFLTLGLATGLLWEVCTVEGFGVILNYGLNKVRFPAPLRVGSRIRMHVALAEVKALDGGAEAIYRLTYEVEGEPKPCCVADLVFRYYA